MTSPLRQWVFSYCRPEYDQVFPYFRDFDYSFFKIIPDIREVHTDMVLQANNLEQPIFNDFIDEVDAGGAGLKD